MTETVQSTANPSWKYILAIKEDAATKSKTVISLIHSLVQTAAFWASSSKGILLGHEEAIIPPIGIETTDAECSSKALIFSWENRLFNCPLETWLGSLVPWVGFFLLLVAADSASSNFLALSYIFAQFMLCGMLMMCWMEPCNIHQLARAAVVVSKHEDLMSAVKSMSKVLKLRKTRKKVEDRLISAWKKKAQINAIRLSSSQLAEAANISRKVGLLLTQHSSATEFHEGLQELRKREVAAREDAERARRAEQPGPGPLAAAESAGLEPVSAEPPCEDASGAPAAEAAAQPALGSEPSDWERQLLRGVDLLSLDESNRAVWAYLAYCNNSSPIGTPSRFDSTLNAENHGAVLEDGAALLRRALFAHGIVQYCESRLLRYTECAHFWAKVHLLCPFAGEVWNSFQKDEGDAEQDEAQGRAKSNRDRQADRVRVKRIQQFHQKPHHRCLFCLWYGSLAHMESLVGLFFYLSGAEATPLALFRRWLGCIT